MQYWPATVFNRDSALLPILSENQKMLVAELEEGPLITAVCELYHPLWDVFRSPYYNCDNCEAR